MADPAATGSAPPPLKEALGWVGFRVDDMNGSRVARVEWIYVDAEDGEPVWVMVKVGRFGKVTAIPYSECADGPGRVWVAHGRKVVRGAPAIEPGKGLTREDELELCDHYLIRPDRGRCEVVGSRPEGALT
ncbi:MAG: PRC-barrel domain-containing protein, partial [Solirubrobacterales bacterium]